MEQKFCQSCGMPLTNEILGTNADGTKNEEYCIYCYKDGAFTDNLTMEEMVESCAQYVDDYNKNTGQNLTQDDQLPPATSPIKQQLLEEVNTFGINGLPKIDNLFVLQGSFINLEYTINGNKVKLLDDNATYWGTQVEIGNGRCFGIACDEQHILVSTYGKGGTNPELLLFTSRMLRC